MKRVSRSSLLMVGLCAIACACAFLAMPSRAFAGKTFCRLERIDPSKYRSDDLLRAYVSVVELEGNVLDDKGLKQFTLSANGKKVGAPIKVEQFQNTHEPLQIALIVEASALYGPAKVTTDALVIKNGKAVTKSTAQKVVKKEKGAPAAPADPAKLGDPIDAVKSSVINTFLDSPDPKWSVLLIDYTDDNPNVHTPFRQANQLEGEVDEISASLEVSADLRLVEALSAAMTSLNKPPPVGQQPPRKAIIVISDGLDYKMDRKIFKGVGDRAAELRIPIHSIGFSPTDDRGPLMNLGEISKRSNGTFRWARNPQDLDAQFATLVDELKKQYVLTFKADSVGPLERKLFTLACEDVISTPFVFKPAELPKGGLKWYWWVLIGFGVLVVLIVIIAVINANRGPVMVMRQPSGGVGGGAMPMPGQQQAAATANANLPQTAILIGVMGGYSGQKVQLNAKQTLIIGKGPSSLQITDDPTVSTRHAEIAFRHGVGFVITDVGSTNGTSVNNARIAQPTLLTDGDMILFGSGSQFKFRTG